MLTNNKIAGKIPNCFNNTKKWKIHRMNLNTKIIRNMRIQILVEIKSIEKQRSKNRIQIKQQKLKEPKKSG